jgi:hypothetical protein
VHPDAQGKHESAVHSEREAHRPGACSSPVERTAHFDHGRRRMRSKSLAVDSSAHWKPCCN